jgi:hypothetical protein
MGIDGRAERARRSRAGRARTPMAALSVAGILAASLVSACRGAPGAQPSAKAQHGALTAATSDPTTTTTTKPPPAPQVPVSLYFMRGDSLGVARRDLPATTDPRTAALKALFGGPVQSEQAAGLSTAIPAGTLLRGLVVTKGTATVSLNPTFLIGGAAVSQVDRAAQVVYTLTQFPNVQDVVFKIAGNAISSFGGVNFNHPLRRTDLLGAVPTVVLESPAVNQSVNSPLPVVGESGFVGTYFIELVDSTGTIVVNSLGTTTPGTSFTSSIPYTTATTGPGTLKLFTRSGARGSQLAEVDVPVTVSP